MNEPKGIVYLYNHWVDVYNESNSGLVGIEKLLSITEGLKVFKKKEKKKITSYIRPIIIECTNCKSKKIKKQIENNILLILEFELAYVEEEFFEIAKELFNEIDHLRLPLTNSEIFKNRRKKYKPKTYADLLALVMTDLEPERILYAQLHYEILTLETLLIPSIIKDKYPKRISNLAVFVESKEEERLKSLDKVPNKHIHRKRQIINKYSELKTKNIQENDSNIREMVQDWYLELTGKEIDESTVRRYIGHR